jgi:DNA-directed RNA polymerase beta subunit
MFISDFFKEGIMEWMSPDEMFYQVGTPQIEDIAANQNNTYVRYEYVMLACNLFGVPALTTPYGNCNNPGRDIFNTNQTKQTNGIYCTQFPYRMDKKAYLQIFNQLPLVKTLINNFIIPNGMNTTVAIMCYNNNQEDSLIFNNSATLRGFNTALYFGVITKKHEGREEIGRPSVDMIQGSPYNFSKLDSSGIIKRYSAVKKGDVLLGIIKKSNDGISYNVNDSIVYNEKEPGIIEDILPNIEVFDKKKYYRVTKIKYSIVRDVTEGDKYSSRHGQKGCISETRDENDLPFTSNGTTPSIIVSSHAIPSRMTIGQLIEGVQSLLCAMEGTIRDGSFFSVVDQEELTKHLERVMDNKYGNQVMYDPLTGSFLDNDVFITPNYYQRLQKYAAAECNAVDTPKISPITRQPVKGFGKGGSTRISELAKDTLVAQGSVYTLQQKFTDDSDGFEIFVCKTCGNMGVYNYVSNSTTCRTCEANKLLGQLVKVRTSWSTKLWMQELQTIGVGINIGTE